MMIWPESSCTNVWIPCPPTSDSKSAGFVTFAGWGFHLITFDLLIVAVITLIIQYNKLQINTALNWWYVFCCPINSKYKCTLKCCGLWVDDEEYNYDDCDDDNENLFCSNLGIFVALFVGGILLSYYLGPFIAYRTFSQCSKYNDTVVSFYLPATCLRKTISNNITLWLRVPNDFNVTSTTTSGSQQECRWCQEIGFAILSCSISGFIIIVWISVLIITWMCKNYYRTKESLQSNLSSTQAPQKTLETKPESESRITMEPELGVSIKLS
jgi:hypothetical protein